MAFVCAVSPLLPLIALSILSLAQSSLHYNKPPSISVSSLFSLLLYQRRHLVNSLPRCASSSLHTVSRLTPALGSFLLYEHPHLHAIYFLLWT